MICAKHNVEMKEFEKDGRKWFSHKLDDGSYCHGVIVPNTQQPQSTSPAPKIAPAVTQTRAVNKEMLLSYTKDCVVAGTIPFSQYRNLYEYNLWLINGGEPNQYVVAFHAWITPRPETNLKETKEKNEYGQTI